LLSPTWPKPNLLQPGIEKIGVHLAEILDHSIRPNQAAMAQFDARHANHAGACILHPQENAGHQPFAGDVNLLLGKTFCHAGG
jgi:hypothetical protein